MELCHNRVVIPCGHIRAQFHVPRRDSSGARSGCTYCRSGMGILIALTCLHKSQSSWARDTKDAATVPILAK